MALTLRGVWSRLTWQDVRREFRHPRAHAVSCLVSNAAEFRHSTKKPGFQALILLGLGLARRKTQDVHLHILAAMLCPGWWQIGPFHKAGYRVLTVRGSILTQHARVCGSIMTQHAHVCDSIMTQHAHVRGSILTQYAHVRGSGMTSDVICAQYLCSMMSSLV